ncbi:HPr family phosphocarrier protein [Pseudalkalibacillus caeni]|nr:HPr family phosphocarrier protein [Pseudalkalibacillus caeni]
MKKIESQNITISNEFTINQLTSFVKKAKTFKSNILIYKNGQHIDGKKLTNLISFYLTIKSQNSVLLVAEGSDAKEAINSLTEKLEGTEAKVPGNLTFS